MKYFFLLFTSILLASCLIESKESRICKYVEANNYGANIVCIIPDSAYVVNALGDFNILKNSTAESLDSIDSLETRYYKTARSLNNFRKYLSEMATIAKNNQAQYHKYLNLFNTKPDACYRVRYSVPMEYKRIFIDEFFVVKHTADGNFQLFHRNINVKEFAYDLNLFENSNKCWLSVANFLNRQWLDSIYD